PCARQERTGHFWVRGRLPRVHSPSTTHRCVRQSTLTYISAAVKSGHQQSRRQSPPIVMAGLCRRLSVVRVDYFTRLKVSFFFAESVVVNSSLVTVTVRVSFFLSPMNSISVSIS